jgi:hypothetical protein
MRYWLDCLKRKRAMNKTEIWRAKERAVVFWRLGSFI